MTPNWKIKLIDVGRGKVTREIDVHAKTLDNAEQRAIKECSRHLMSRDIGLGDKLDLTYTVFAGMRSVGRVEIISI